ncbi:DUF2948 family protein [Nisaea acidiphila]|uniref:DUF2948 family protein n=1 Tax=Nisaea acidiphila TaxID=1862145 RepID=A0A9J7AX41_9PROT|nr:DUF2948 family protein [Nisaea acidiphila]UUX51362.1 DUF2948 family protein [Nisaea acidiphila]
MVSRDVSLLAASDRPFRVRAEDADDLSVVAAYLQDALLPVSEMTYEPNDGRFVMVVQRFRWETAPEDGTVPADGDTLYAERVHCGIRFDGVSRVQTHGFERSKRDRILNLLTVHPSDGQIDLAFADNVTIRLAVDRILCHIEDLGEPWPTVFTPSHPQEDAKPAPADEASGA